MTNHTTTSLVSRQAAGITPSVPVQAVPSPLAGLPEKLQLANALSKAGPLLPECYRDKPGAVLLLMSWAEQHGKDLLTAAQGVKVNDKGQLIVSAEMRTELANDRGYDVIDVTDDAKRREECTVQVTGPGLPPAGRRLTVRMEEIHESVRALTYKSGAPTPWATSPADMLLRTAQRQADKRFCRSAAAVIDQEDWVEPERDDVVDVLTAERASALAADGLPAEPEFHVSPEEADAQDDDLTAPPPEPITEAQLRKLGTAKVLRAAKDLGTEVALIGDVAKDQDLARRIVDRLSAT
jgi:hypothetical protein